MQLGLPKSAEKRSFPLLAIKPPSRFVQRRELISVIVAGVVVLLSSIAIPSWTSSMPLNGVMLQILSPALVPLLFLVPLAMYFAYYTQSQVRYNDMIKKYYNDLEAQTERRIIFRSKMKPCEGGSQWEVRNGNSFVWTGVKLLIERTAHGEVFCEQHQVGVLGARERVLIQSDLEHIEFCQWRVMVITQQGEHIDFPDIYSPPLVEEGYEEMAIEQME